MASYLPRNDRSGVLLKRLGFEIEGKARAYLRINGRWEDHILRAASTQLSIRSERQTFSSKCFEPHHKLACSS